ncbi:putative ribonuclease H protein [Nymphaea thermarum]|nr:putative ribonuclease H protein [Nymphaea thermarum]
MFVISHACVRTLLRQPSFGFLSARGAAGGILLAWSPPLTGAVVHVGRYSISASLSGFWPNGPVLVTAVYGPCVGALRRQLWVELHQVRQLAASPWLLAGDFNCLLSLADSSSPVTSGPSVSAFRSFVDEFGLFDVPSTNGTFTWSNNRNPSILRRLDCIFLSPELFSAFPSSSLVLCLRHLSDHAPLLLTLMRGRAAIGHARFRFELWWLRDESFVATVPNWWARAVNGRWAAFRLSRKVHSIRREVLAWKRIFWSSKFSEVADWDEEILSLQASDDISADQSSRLLCLQCLAQEWRISESIHWQQRSRLGWLALGDQNSRFFYLAASQRRRQTLLQSMGIGGRGYPLSPLLFNMVAESFSALFHHATVVGFLTPHSLSHLPSFSTLQYADDFLLFGSASHQQVVRTWLILRVFELISGLSINSAKCHLSLIHADPATVLLAEACFGCKATGLPMDYLGLQITLSSPAPSFWDGVEQKLTYRLQCWQRQLLSLPGRITLAKHCLASVPLHALSVFRPLVAVLCRFDKLIRKFVWDEDRPSDRLAHWDVVAFSRLLGGAGVTNLSRACESSLCSWWWRLATEHSPITQFISSKFDLPSPSVWHSSISHTSPSHFWSDMLSVPPLFLRLADLSSSTSPSWPLSPTREFTFSSCYLVSFGHSVASLPPRSLWSPGPSPRAIAFAWLLLTGHINTFDHLQRLGISLANQCPLCLVATESRVHIFTSCTFFSSVFVSTWHSLVSSLPNPPSIRLLFLFCPSPHLTASWDHVWRPWLISTWWHIWAERNNRVFRGTFSSPDFVARLVQGDVQFAIRLKRRCQSPVG